MSFSLAEMSTNASFPQTHMQAALPASTLPSPRIQDIWSLWIYFFQTNMTGIAMAMILSRCSIYFTNALLKSDKSPSTGRPTISGKTWEKLGIILEEALEFLVVAAFHPMVAFDGFSDMRDVPKFTNLVSQIALLLVISKVVWPVVYGFYTQSLDEEDVDAVELSTMFISPRVTLHLGIVVIQGLKILGIGRGVGSIHFTSLWGWLLLRDLILAYTG